MRIDAHQHFWNYNPQEYGWINDNMKVLRKDFGPLDLLNELSKAGLDGSVAVQARQSLEETRWLLHLASANKFIKGVVGWVDLCGREVEGQLEEFASETAFKGVRHVLQDEPDDEFMLCPAFVEGISKLKEYNLTYDILIFPRHIKYACQLVNKFPNQRFVIDHLAKPFIKKGSVEPWKSELRSFLKIPNVFCKLSGMVTEASWNQWRQEDFEPYMEAVIEIFGPARVMFGSDWPVCTVAAAYEETVEIVRNFISRLSVSEQVQIMGQTAMNGYSL
jgi:L-fuconolactonase